MPNDLGAAVVLTDSRRAHASPGALDAEWSVARVAPGTLTTPDQLDTAALDWTAAPLGTAAAMWRSAGRWRFDDPFDFDAWDWWFRGTFRAEQTQEARQILGIGGLATIADVWLNGVHVLRSDNMFLAHELDVTSQLGDSNTLVIRCTALKTALATRRPRPAWRTRLIEQQQLRWIRTTLLGRMPGWSSSPAPVGPWRPITLASRATPVCTVTAARATIDGTDGVVTLTVRLDAQGATSVVAHVGDAHTTLTRDGNAGDTTFSGTIRVPNAQRWWPHTHGTPARYPLAFTVTADGTDVRYSHGHVAFREIALDTTDGNFALSVNGEPIFCRGACWSSADVAALTTTREGYRAALTLARDAGMNMLRVGGTMTYEADDFYELCDELGILVWQDAMFSNMDYPFSDETFMQSVNAELAQFFERTQTRACLAVVCGNNEIEQQTAMLGLPRERWSHPFFQETLPALCHAHRPDVAYWPSSPSGGTFPFHADAGDTHYFGYGPYLREFDDVRTSGIRFASETLAFAHLPDQPTIDLLGCGEHGAGHHPVWKAGVPRDNGSSWDFEDVRDHYIDRLFGVSSATLRRTMPDRYLSLGRVVSGEVITRAVSEWRRHGSRCNGALLWFYRDLRPGAGWGVIDATGRPKAAYYYVRRVNRPVTVFVHDDGLNGLSITARNESPDTHEIDVRLAVYRHGEVVVADVTRTLTLAPRTSDAWRADAMLDGFTDLSYAYHFGPPGHDLVVVSMTARDTGALLGDAYFFPTGLPATQDRDPALSATLTPDADGRYTLTVRATRFAQSVAIDIPYFMPDDNYFHVPPGEMRLVTLTPVQPNKIPVGTLTPLNGVSAIRVSGEGI